MRGEKRYRRSETEDLLRAAQKAKNDFVDVLVEKLKNDPHPLPKGERKNENATDARRRAGAYSPAHTNHYSIAVGETKPRRKLRG